jgi:tRNA threonylcarbamoyladenosine biosynthesis protein TsaB
MKIVGIETSSIQGGVAVLEVAADDSILLLKKLQLKCGLIHGKLLIPALDRLLKKVGWRKESINLVSIDIGPGSYTGLRVGLAIAKTISYVLKSQIVGVPSLDVLLDNVSQNREFSYICPLIDAKWNQVYTAVYKRKNPPEPDRDNDKSYELITDYLAITPSDLIKLLKRIKSPDKILVFGDGLKPYKGLLSQLQDKVVFGQESIWYPRATNVALSGYRTSKEGKLDNPLKILPFYLRPTEAEKQKNQRIGGRYEKIPHMGRN